MKKKGLLISTIVMVVVLVASLTTATYAWFTVDSITTVDGFNLSVVGNNILNIGLKINNTYDDKASADAFVSGDCTYKYDNSKPGTLAGQWTGDPGMAASISHNIKWGNVSSAVGISKFAIPTDSVTNENIATYANIGNTLGFTNFVLPTDTSNVSYFVSANKNNAEIDKEALAVPNLRWVDGTNDTAGDFAYLFLGVSPTKTLAKDSNKLYIVVQASGNGTTLGIASAVHVAYRLNSNGAWSEEDVFGTQNKYTTLRTADSAKVTLPLDITQSTTTITGTVTGTEGNKSTALEGAAVVVIDLNEVAIGSIEQLELVIYLAGWDSDCIDAAKGVTANVGLFFTAQECAHEDKHTDVNASDNTPNQICDKCGASMA